MVEVQGGECAICGQEDSRRRADGSPFPLSVDHDHDSGKLRALLCTKCNVGLGHFRDDPDLLLRAAEYLKLWKRAT